MHAQYPGDNNLAFSNLAHVHAITGTTLSTDNNTYVEIYSMHT